jgi:hypothetical protein
MVYRFVSTEFCSLTLTKFATLSKLELSKTTNLFFIKLFQ